MGHVSVWVVAHGIVLTRIMRRRGKLCELRKKETLCGMQSNKACRDLQYCV